MFKQQANETRTRVFTASEVAEFAYCPLTWWHEQFEPWARAENDELFARLVELEHEHATQAPDLPEYQMIEQLLVKRGAFEQGQAQHRAHAEALAEFEPESDEEDRSDEEPADPIRHIRTTIFVLGALAVVLIISGLLWH